MKTIGMFVVVSFLIQAVCGPHLQAANENPDPAGYWDGAIALPNMPLVVKVELTRSGDQLSGTIDIPAQGLRGFALSPVKADGTAITFGMPGVPGDPLFNGQISGDAKTITGEFSQGGQKLPFKLARSVRPAPVVDLPGVAGKGLQGQWQGSLKPAPNVELRLALEIIDAAGKSGGTLISLDQGGARIPLTTLSETAPDVHFETASVGGSFDGKFNADGSELSGTWIQHGNPAPLTFKRLASPAKPAAAATAPSAKISASASDASSLVQFQWLMLSPIPVLASGSTGQPDEAAQKKAFASDLLANNGGEASVTPQLGKSLSINGVERQWTAVAAVDGVFTLNSPEQKEDFQIAYAGAEFDVPSDTQAWLGVGSDDGVRVWLNGTLVHDHWIGRAVQLDEDVVPVTLKAGKNRMLVKVQNRTGGWGFACRIMDADARVGRLVMAARSGDIPTLKTLADRGFDLNAHTSDGLTPLLAARMAGQKEAADFLTAKGADPHATPPSPEALVDRLLSQRIDKDGAAVVVLVAQKGKILYQKAFGLADIEQHVPATLETKFRIGSITKQFTAASILRLQEAGKLKITDPLSKYYSDFPRGDDVSLERLLTHTSGIHSYTDAIGFIQGVTKPTATADVVNSIKKFPADFKPGERWSYSNSNYFILGDVVQKASGVEYADFLQKTFFTPLGMSGTGVYRNDRPPVGAAVGYEYQSGQSKKAMDWDMSWAGGAGAIYSTVGDLYRWNEALFGGKLINQANLTAAFTPVITEENRKDKSEDGYGYGWMISHFRGAREISHGGGLHGFLANLARLPDRDFTVVVLTNQAPPKPHTDPATLSHEIVELYLGAQLAPRAKPMALVAKAVPAAALAAIVGRYDYRNAILVVSQEGDHAYAQLGGQPRFEIFPKSETEFFWKVVDAQVDFVKDEAGNVVEAIHHQGGQTLHAPRLKPVPEITLDDAQTDLLLGDYDFKPVGKATISRNSGRMYAQLTGQPKLELGATSATELFLRAVNAQLTFVKDKDGNVSKLILHQGGQDIDMPKLIQP